MRRWAGVIAWLAATLAAHHSGAQQEQPIVREIEIRYVGPETVSRAIVRANIQITVGQSLSREMIEQDVKNLIATGFFFDVRVLEESVANGVKVIYQVQGKATIKEILFEGNVRYKADRLQREVDMKAGDILDELKAHVGTQKIAEMYQKAGYPDVKVEYNVSVDRDTGKCVLRFKVTEGPRVFIEKIDIQGNKAFPDGRLLKIMKTRKRWWGSWFSGTGVLKDEQFKEDLESLRAFYQSNGYLDMEIRDTKIDRISTKWMVIRIVIFEGTQYKVGEILIEGNTLFPTVELQRRLPMTAGMTFTPEGLTADTTALENYYGARGYLDTNVRAIRVANIETGRMDLTYTIHEGELTYIELVEIRGNTKTKDKVIRRELAVAPGDIYDTVRVDASVARLKNLNYFSKVEAVPELTPVPNRRNLVVNVEEQRTGSVTFGAGFSSIDNLLGFVELTQGNFDLFNPPSFTGGGQKLRLLAQLGTERQDFVLSYVQPWFLDRRISLGFDAYHRTSNFLSNDFEQKVTGGSITLNRALSEFTRGGVAYSLQDINLDVVNNASQQLQSQNGTTLRSAMLFTYVFDSRNNLFLTTRGNRTELAAELIGGPLGGQESAYKWNASTTFYFPMPRKGHVLQVLGAIGVVQAFGATRGNATNVTETVIDIDKTTGMTNIVTVLKPINPVPIFDRFFLGGANNLRGFEFRDVGPKDINDQPIGGNTSVNGTVEYSLPVIERVRFAVFFDIGEVKQDSYSFSLNSLKADVGAGVRLNLPVGPLRLDYGWPIITDPRSGESGQIQFSVGYQF